MIDAKNRAMTFLVRGIAENAVGPKPPRPGHPPRSSATRPTGYLITIPDIEPKTVSELAIFIDIDNLPNHDRLALY